MSNLNQIPGVSHSGGGKSINPQSKNIRVGIVGGAGYTGGELIRLLLHHPNTNISFIHSRSQAGKKINTVHADLLGETDLLFSDSVDEQVDVVFLCLGHGEAKEFLQEKPLQDRVKIIDLSQDFRLATHATFNSRSFVYGLPELNKEAIRQASNVANPGCFATAIQLALLPLAKAGLLQQVYSTGITGATGAGQGLIASSHFSWRNNNIQAYKTLTHQHLREINQSLQQAGAQKQELHFVPWRGDFARGIFTSSTVACNKTLEDVLAIYESFYNNAAFTHISHQAIYMKQVVNTNNCVIQIEKIDGQLVVHSAIDNLLKGASGQAVQNMNLMFGLDEKAGLNLKAVAF